MELKVWVEGIQRVVCGVNEKTTCQDVVYALAHATGKTGRFTLIERWRNSERLLAPGEQPLKVLLKWGEHSNDVQFILQWSPLDSSSSSGKNTSPGKSGQSGNNNNTSGGGGGGDTLSENLHNPPSQYNKGGALPYGTSAGVSSGSGINTNQQNCLPQNNGLSPSLSSSSSKKFSSYSPSSSSYHSSSNNLPPNQRPSNHLGNSNSASSVKQYPHLNGGSVGGGKLHLSEASSGLMKGAPQRLIHSDAIKDFPSSSSSVSSGKVSSSSQGGLSLPPGAPPPLVGKMKELSAPPPYREPPNPISYQGKVSPSVSSPSSINSQGMKGLPPYREPPPPTMIQQQQSPSQYSNAYQLRHSSNSSNSPVRGVSNSQVPGGGSQSFFGSSANSSSSSLLNNVGNSSSSVSASGVPTSKDSPSRHGPPMGISPSPQLDVFPSSYNNASDKSDNSSFWNNKDQHLINGDISSNQNGSISKSALVPNSVDSPNSHYKELVRLVNSQREKLTSQQAELTQFDAEIMFWEGKAKEQQRNMEFITKEISRLEAVSSQNESQVLSLAHLEEENEYVRQESESLKHELTSLRGELGKCENELDKCRNRLRKLVDELQATQAAASQRQDEWLKREAATLAEVERLQQELELARRETDAVSDLSGSLDKEVHCLDSTLAEKKKQMEVLVSAMKEANLQSLIINPPEEVVDGGAHQRSGSTRRMIGSPRQLENAAPTSKNPHGVWV